MITIIISSSSSSSNLAVGGSAHSPTCCGIPGVSVSCGCCCCCCCCCCFCFPPPSLGRAVLAGCVEAADAARRPRPPVAHSLYVHLGGRRHFLDPIARDAIGGPPRTRPTGRQGRGMPLGFFSLLCPNRRRRFHRRATRLALLRNLQNSSIGERRGEPVSFCQTRRRRRRRRRDDSISDGGLFPRRRRTHNTNSQNPTRRGPATNKKRSPAPNEPVVSAVAAAAADNNGSANRNQTQQQTTSQRRK